MKPKNRLRGTVLEVNAAKKYMLVITPDRNFEKIPLPRIIPDVGGEVEFNAADLNRANMSLGRMAAVAAILIIGLCLGYFLHGFYTVSTYLALDINPSLELEINRYNRVIRVSPLNGDGEMLAKSVRNNYRDVEDYLEMLLREAEEKQYLDREESNVIMVSYTGRDDSELDSKAIEKILVAYCDELEISYHVIVNRVDPGLREQSRKEEMSMNRALVKEIIRKHKITVVTGDDGENLGRLVSEIMSSREEPPPGLAGEKKDRGSPDTAGPDDKKEKADEKPGKGLGRDKDNRPETPANNKK